VKREREAPEGAAFDGATAGVGPLDLRAHTTLSRIIARPEKFKRPNGGLAVLVVEIEKRAVVAAVGRGGEPRGEEGLERRGSLGVDGDFDGQWIAGLRGADAMPAWGHVLDGLGRRGRIGERVGECSVERGGGRHAAAVVSNAVAFQSGALPGLMLRVRIRLRVQVRVCLPK